MFLNITSVLTVIFSAGSPMYLISMIKLMDSW